MALITYVLIIGFLNGVGLKFSPDILGKTISWCLGISLLENVIMKIIFYFYQLKKGTFLEFIAIGGYKYIGMCLIVLSDIMFGYYTSLAVGIYIKATFAFFTYKTIQRF